MNYININTMRYPMRTNAIRAENPNISFSTIFNPPDWYQPVITTAKPDYDEWTQDVRELTPLNDNGQWLQQWEVVPRFVQYADADGTVHSVSEQAEVYRQNKLAALAATIRYQRNELLSKSDWTQTLDAPVDQPAWANYRLSLRNLPLQEGFPLTVSWPVAPA